MMDRLIELRAALEAAKAAGVRIELTTESVREPSPEMLKEENPRHIERDERRARLQEWRERNRTFEANMRRAL